MDIFLKYFFQEFFFTNFFHFFCFILEIYLFCAVRPTDWTRVWWSSYGTRACCGTGWLAPTSSPSSPFPIPASKAPASGSFSTRNLTFKMGRLSGRTYRPATVSMSIAASSCPVVRTHAKSNTECSKNNYIKIFSEIYETFLSFTFWIFYSLRFFRDSRVWLIDWLSGVLLFFFRVVRFRSIGCFIYWLIDWSIDWLNDWMVHGLIDWLIDWLGALYVVNTHRRLDKNLFWSLDIPEGEAMELQKKLAVFNSIMDQEMETLQRQQRRASHQMQNGKHYWPLTDQQLHSIILTFLISICCAIWRTRPLRGLGLHQRRQLSGPPPQQLGAPVRPFLPPPHRKSAPHAEAALNPRPVLSPDGAGGGVGELREQQLRNCPLRAWGRGWRRWCWPSAGESGRPLHVRRPGEPPEQQQRVRAHVL